MRERTELLIRGMTENRTKRHRWLAMVTALAFLTGGNVFWSLREIGTAVTEETLCTREAHQHSEECYDENGSLICGKEEHVHTAACFSDENADVETADIWEATLPERDGLLRQEQVALIAESQLGYTESMNNFILGEDGTQHGYTRYGAWYGNPYGEWNTMFTYFCLYYAGVSTEEIPCGGNARTWQVKLTENELIRPPDSEPERGEIVLLDLDADGEADLTGIVTDAAEMLHFVEGNLGHAVAEGELALDAEQILGYVAIPEPDTPDAENPEASPPDESLPEDADESSPDAEPAPTEEQPAASESEQPLVTYKAESASGIQVSAVTAEGVFPADTVMTVTDVPREEALQAAAEGLSADTGTLDAVAVDISFYAADGTELEPAGGVDVQITLPETQQLAGEEFTLLHVADDGAVQTVEAEITHGAAYFTSGSFSIYVLASDGTTYTDKDAAITVNGVSIPNSEDNPYVVCVGDTFKIRTKSVKWTDNNNNEQGYPYFPVNHSILSEVAGSYNEQTEGDITYRIIEKDYQAVAVGSEMMHLVENSSWAGSDFYVKVVDTPQIYVKTALGERSKDEVHEYIDWFAGWFSANPEDFVTDGSGTPKYVKNKEAGDYPLSFRPYRMSNGDDIELVSYVPASLASTYSFAEGNSGTHTVDLLTVYNKPDEYVGDGMVRKSAIVHADNSGGSKRTGVKFGDDYFYIVVDADIQSLSHADIEIADGGTYTVVYETTDIAGNRTTTTIIYDAFVSAVNTCKIYNAENEPLKIIDGDKAGQDVIFYTNDYIKINENGQSQYELTSNYIDEAHNLRGDRNFYLKDAQKAVFDVQLKLTPKSITTSVNGSDPVSGDISSLDTQVIKSAVFPLERRDIIDAYNKCPYHSGLDFTIKSALADKIKAVCAQAMKKVEFDTSGTAPMMEGAFTFELLDVTDQKAWKVSNEDRSQVPPGVLSSNSVFSDMTTGDDVIAFQIFSHNDYSHFSDGFDSDGFKNEYPSYGNTLAIGTLIDRYNAGNALESDISQETFYAAMLKYVRAGKAIQTTNNQFNLEAGHYLFQKLSVVGEATNDAAGNIIFEPQFFSSPGIYHYYIREKDTGDTAYGFDSQLHKVTVTVTENSSGTLSASVAYDNGSDLPMFTNTLYTYTLPSTGGAGTLPWYLGGTAILAAASLLMIKKRREGS